MNEKQLLEEAFSGLSESERDQALKILQEYANNGNSELMNKLKYADFEEIPVNIHTFLHDKRYLGNALYDSEGRFTLFPYWERCLEDIFPDNISTKYNNIVFTGAIGLGKSTIAVICQLYLLYRLLCLKNPYTYYGMQNTDKISISFMNITIENAKGVALDKLNQMVLSSEWFMAHGEMSGTTNLIYRPQKHIELIAASGNNQIIGRAIFCNFTDEANFALFSNPEKQKKKMMKIITQVDARMKSRYMRTKSDGSAYLPTLNIIASSKDTEQSFLEEYIDITVKNNSQTTLIIDEPQWVVDSRKDSPIKFWVALGDKFKANELLPTDATEQDVDKFRRKGYKMYQVPIGYLETFQKNLDEAICSIIGIATASSLKYISGIKLNETKSNDYENPFTKDVLEIGSAASDLLQYSNFFDLTKIDDIDRQKPLFIHLDMSTGSGGLGDKTGIAGVWITGKKSNINHALSGLEESVSIQDESSQDLHYKLAFSVSIKAPQGSSISFAKNRNFIRWLREQGFNIKGVSADTYQSANIQQDLISEGFDFTTISVDRVQKDSSGRPVCLPYHYFKTSIYERRLKIYQKCNLLTDEIIGLERKSDGHIDHTKDGINSKDQADAVCGATFNASKHADQFAYEFGETLASDLEVNDIQSDLTNRAAYMKAFEEELSQIYKELDEVDSLERKKRQEEWQNIKDIQDGIIII